MKRYLLIAALAVPTMAAAHDPLTYPPYAPAIQWLDGPNTGRSPGNTNIRVVQNGPDEVIALSLNQQYLYQAEYKKRLAQLAMHMPVSQAEPRAAHDAIQRVLQVYPRKRVGPLQTTPIAGGRIGHDG
ncbi:hypothetical protein [Jannaschia sp. 2305UL9-9]|uniref:hypothetical protein n=1 Tax=Jannaschia sp. 2305UL9-9 TaxID=3121638 RepID=UPI003527864D